MGSEDTSKPGFNVKVYQVGNLTDPNGVTSNLPESIELSEGVLAGLVGPNVADLTAPPRNTFTVPGVIDWVNTGGAVPIFQMINVSGIPGCRGEIALLTKCSPSSSSPPAATIRSV